jgi:hypothetical protein
MTQFLVKFKVTEQVSPDDFERVTKERLFNEDTKLSTIKEWVVSKGGNFHNKNGYKQMLQVYLSEPDTF